jgi:hypothetical protein
MTRSAAISLRLNMDLREDKGWSYGVSGDMAVLEHAVPDYKSRTGQADRRRRARRFTRQINEFLTIKGVTATATRLVENINQLPGEFETSGAVLGA